MVLAELLRLATMLLLTLSLVPLSRGAMVQNVTISDVVVPLFGGLRVGEYYAKIEVGEPPVEYRVQIDTGSSLLLIPDAACDGCTLREGGATYAAVKSTTALPLPCTSPQCGVQTCSSSLCFSSVCSREKQACCSEKSPTDCAFGVHYGGGTEAQGALVSDTVRIGSVTTRLTFGRILAERGRWEASLGVDGILGIGLKALGCDPTCVDPLLYELVADRVLHDGFSTCMGDGSGQLVMGGVDPRFYTPPLQFTPLVKPLGTTKLTYYSVAFTDVRLGEKSVFGHADSSSSSSSAMPYDTTAVVDSGSTSLLFARNIFDAIQASFQRDYCHLPGVCATPSVIAEPANGGIQGARPCLRAMPLASEWPTLQLELGPSLTLHLPPHLYFVRAGSDFCYGIDATPASAGNINIFGDTLLRGFYTVYDHTNLRVGFAQQNMLLCGFPGPGGVNKISPAMDTLPAWASPTLLLLTVPLSLLYALASCFLVGRIASSPGEAGANGGSRHAWNFQRVARYESRQPPPGVSSYQKGGGH